MQTVRDWLHEFGISADAISQSTNRQWLQFDATAAVMEGLLATEYFAFEHEATGRSTIGCDAYSLPNHVRSHVDYITPGLKLLTPSLPKDENARSKLRKRTFKSTGHIKSGKKLQPPVLHRPTPMALPTKLSTLLARPLGTLCKTAIVPDCISTMYNITSSPLHAPGNEMGIFEDLGDVYSQADLDDFFLTFARGIPTGTHPVFSPVDGGIPPVPVTAAGPESDLDFQVSYPILWPQNSVLFQTDDLPTELDYTYVGFLNNFLDAIDGSYCYAEGAPQFKEGNIDPPYPDSKPSGYLGNLQCGAYKPTNVISISYGGQEYDLPIAYQKRQCNEFMKLGLQGVSVVVASGDSGVAGIPYYQGDNGCLGSKKNIFSPDFPATCPYVTAVGGTVLTGEVTRDEERASVRYGSGGGFSNIYPTASYQRAAVSRYLVSASSSPPYKYYVSNNNASFGAGGGLYNRAGRGYPDVSAVGDNIAIFVRGRPGLIGGTSASAPVFGAILTRINEERIAKGKSTIGFVNPVLYAHPEVLHDITVGNNQGCGTPGFSCAAGWDPGGCCVLIFQT